MNFYHFKNWSEQMHQMENELTSFNYIFRAGSKTAAFMPRKMVVIQSSVGSKFYTGQYSLYYNNYNSKQKFVFCFRYGEMWLLVTIYQQKCLMKHIYIYATETEFRSQLKRMQNFINVISNWWKIVLFISDI